MSLESVRHQEAANPCAECGMFVRATEYHPYAACLMFKACLDSETVRANLQAVIEHELAQQPQGEE